MPKRQTQSVTIRDVARLAGVSPITASRALNKPEKVKDETQKKVREAANTLRYIPNLAAGTLSSSVSNMVAVIVPNMSNSIFADTLKEISAGLRPAGYQLLIGNSDYSPDEEEALVRTFLSRRTDAIVLTGHLHTQATIDMIRNADIPVVEMWSLTQTPLEFAVGTSNYDAALAATRHLIERGRKNIAYVGGNPDWNDRAQARIAGYRDALLEAGMEYDEGIMRLGSFEFDTGSDAVISLLQDGKPMDAIFAASDIIALGALLECLRQGVSVPERISICGLDDAQIARIMKPALTTVAVPRHEIGRKVAEVILAKLGGEDVEKTVYDMGYSLVVRDTT